MRGSFIMSGTLSLRVIEAGNLKTVLLCDAELIGKKFTQDKGILDIKEEYYKGELVDEEDAAMSIREADYISLIGERSVSLGIKEGMIHPEAVMKISGIPYAIFVNTRV
ncbi:MAG: DUF424 family protein [Thermoprotei archaeon]|jgi:hypothetical protein|uniref:DUF424 family protein n=1 Tax=Fervidicoccus fontis TaxID=683846 RepID=A0A7J3SNK6_9CREN|nr:DUF424 family protein [Thermoprotei archaeon]